MAKAGSELRLDGDRKPRWLLLELTYRCPLKCPWCNNPLDLAEQREELTTEEWKRVLREARGLGSLQLGFSGGEPALRRDLEELVSEAHELGYYTNLITSGMGLSRSRLEELKRVGLNQIQLSIQHADKDSNDAMVGARAFDAKLAIGHEMKALGFPMVLNVPVSCHNIDATEDIIRMAEELGVEFVEMANIQYYNWALLNRAGLMPTREQLERAEAIVIEARKRLGSSMTIYFVIPDYFEGRPKACMNGWGAIHLTIAPDGSALPCQEARVIKGLNFPSVREHTLEWIWNDSPTFNKFRGESWMKEPCLSCDERKEDFGGCRCQAFLLTGDAANADPACTKSPDYHVIETAIADAQSPHRVPLPLVMRQPGAVSMALMNRKG